MQENTPQQLNIEFAEFESSPSKIEDFGEKIGGAKKDLAQKYSERLSTVADSDLDNIPLRKIFPVSDLRSLTESGYISQESAIFINYIYDRLPARPVQNTVHRALPRNHFILPVQENSRDKWKNDIRKAINLVTDIIQNPNQQSTPMLMYVTRLREQGNISASMEADMYLRTMKALNFPTSDIKLGKYRIVKLTRNFSSLYAVVSGRQIYSQSPSFDEAVEKLSEKLQEKNSRQKVSLKVYQSRLTKDIFIGKELPGKEPIPLREGFKTGKEALQYLDLHKEELEREWNSLKSIPDERRESNSPRSGIDWRNGQNITPEIFIESFGFRGVEFGNWVNQVERQKALNDAYEGLMDLAHTINLPSRALSLNGELGLAFGSRGSGNASAHYEQDKIVINLTKTKGAGSLAHEWWHGLDNYFSRMGGNRLGMASEYSRRLEIRTEMQDAFEKIKETIHRSELPDRSRRLDSLRSKNYWGTNIEMSARAFESYIVDKSESSGKNDYLVNFKTPEEWGNNKNYPYPNLQEKVDINSVFNNFFDTLQTRLIPETGKTILFRQVPGIQDSQTFSFFDDNSIIEQAKKDGTYMKAPNGNPTNLSEKQWVQVRTKAFKEWFGDWEKDSDNASKILDENKEPLITLHGSRSAGFDEFEESSPGFYFTDNMEIAKVYANDIPIAYSPWSSNDNAIYCTFLSIKNPIVVNAQGREWSDLQFRLDGNVLTSAEEIIEYIRKNRTGNDGVIIHNVEDGNENRQQGSIFVSVSPNQIKDAYANNGKFNVLDNNIRFNIIGKKGAQNDPAIQNNLDIATVMEHSRKKPEEIYLATGWERTKDNNRWKYDLPAEDIRFLAAARGDVHYSETRYTAQLGNIIDYPTLFKCYPQLKGIEVTFTNKNSSDGSYFTDGKITINTSGKNTQEQLESLIHEIQHAIQSLEGFARGGSPERFVDEYLEKIRNINFAIDGRFPPGSAQDLRDFLSSPLPGTDIIPEIFYAKKLNDVAVKFGFNSISDLLDDLQYNTPHKKYFRLAGEVEARNASTRLNMTARQRSMKPISETEDTIDINKIYSSLPYQISAEIDHISQKLCTPVEKVYSRSELPPHIQKAMQPENRYPGLFDSSSKQVYIIINEINNATEAQATMLHEILGHKGIRSLFPDQKSQDDFFDRIWDIIPQKEKPLLMRKYGKKAVAAEEYMAKFAEGYYDPKSWEKIKAIIKNVLQKIGITMKLSDNDLRYILFNAKKTLIQNKGPKNELTL